MQPPLIPEAFDYFPPVSAVVPTHNRGPFLERAVRSLACQKYPADRYEVVVVDDGSTDDTQTVLARCREEFPSLRVLTQRNRGPAFARNAGIQAARGEIILLMDDDCTTNERWAFELTRPYVDPEVGAVAGQIRFAPPAMNLANRIAAAGPPSCGQPVDASGNLAFFVTANASLRRTAFEEVGGFDEAFPHAAQEDLDLSYRMRNAGWKLQYVDAAVVDHHHHHTFRRDLRRAYQIGQAEITLFRKHGIPYSAYRDLAAAFVGVTRIPFGIARNLFRGEDALIGLAGPPLYRLSRVSIAAGRVRGHWTERQVTR